MEPENASETSVNRKEPRQLSTIILLQRGESCFSAVSLRGLEVVAEIQRITVSDCSLMMYVEYERGVDKTFAIPMPCMCIRF